MNQASKYRDFIVTSSGRSIPVIVNVNPRAKRILVRIDPKNRVAVAVAPSSRYKKRALSHAENNADWIAERLDSLPPESGLRFGVRIPLRGVEHVLDQATRGRSVTCAQSENGPVILVPGREDLIEAKLKGYLRACARADLTERVALHAQTLEVSPKSITIKDTRSRWGSCSSTGNLNFSWRLICAPPHILDYVAAHEVAHLREMNHSPRFWAHVERCFPEYPAARNWLNTHGRALHAVVG